MRKLDLYPILGLTELIVVLSNNPIYFVRNTCMEFTWGFEMTTVAPFTNMV